MLSNFFETLEDYLLDTSVFLCAISLQVCIFHPSFGYVLFFPHVLCIGQSWFLSPIRAGKIPSKGQAVSLFVLSGFFKEASLKYIYSYSSRVLLIPTS